MTRAQAVSFLWREQGSPAAPPPRFSDVPSGSWEAGAVGWADAEGIAAGYAGGDRFGPSHLVARAHTATFLWRTAGRPPVPEPDLPPFRLEVRGIDAALAERMSASWRPGCPVPLADLRYLTIRHWGFHGRPVDGEMVVHADAVEAVRQIFAWGYGARFPIERMRLIDDYGGDDDRSMAANNTSAFNCRHVGGTTTWSEHAHGRAIDVNPVQNPWVAGTRVEPPAGAAHLDRTRPDLGLIREGGPLHRRRRRRRLGLGRPLAHGEGLPAHLRHRPVAGRVRPVRGPRRRRGAPARRPRRGPPPRGRRPRTPRRRRRRGRRPPPRARAPRR
jgi:hypothetical protein